MARKGRSKARATLGVLLSFGMSALLFGCAGANGSAADTRNEGLPVWETAFRDLFDDDIEPPVTSLMAGATIARGDPLLRERARTAEWVGRVRVSTVTVQSSGGRATYRIVVEAVAAPFITPKISDTSWEFVVGPTARAYQLTRAYENRLRESQFIGFLRRFAGEGGEPELHWHLSPDSADVAIAVKDALGLAELSGT